MMSFVSVVEGAVGVGACLELEAFLEQEVILAPGAFLEQEVSREVGSLNSVDLYLLQQPKR